MKIKVSFNMDFNMENIEKETNKSIEEQKEYIDKNLRAEIEELLKFEIEYEDRIMISDVKIIKEEVEE